jgi:hypothetical protein
LLRPIGRPRFRRERVDTPDGDFLDLDWCEPEASGAPVVVVLHGLAGSSRSHYVSGLCREAAALGLRAVILNFRSCSGELNRTARLYHSGETSDLDAVLGRLIEREPAVRVGLVGISLGGNVLLKWLGERGAAASRLVHRAAAVSAPIDLAACGNTLDRGFNRRTYTRAFLATLVTKALAKRDLGQLEFDARRLAKARTLREFDDMITAPLHGFRDADDYWKVTSTSFEVSTLPVGTMPNVVKDATTPESPAGTVADQFQRPPESNEARTTGKKVAAPPVRR